MKCPQSLLKILCHIHHEATVQIKSFCCGTVVRLRFGDEVAAEENQTSQCMESGAVRLTLA